MKKVFYFFHMLILYGISFSATIHVPDDQLTIQAGIDSAAVGDTVLVKPNTYTEYIDFKGKNAVVGSFFLTTGDTSYISQTVIEGGVEFSNGEDSTAVLSGFTILQGINCKESGPSLENVIIRGDQYEQYGPGLYCDHADPRLMNSMVANNSASDGGGIYCENSDLTLVNVMIANNEAYLYSWEFGMGGLGGGIYCRSSNISMMNVVLLDNHADLDGGGIYLEDTNIKMQDVVIKRNRAVSEYASSGGGVCCYGNNPNFKNVTISNNYADKGGGIYCSDSDLNFSYEKRCNIYLNHAIHGNDIYIDGGKSISVVVDTFTVIHPTDRHIYPMNKCSYPCNILHAKVVPVAADLYVSPFGEDSNTGLSPSEPLQSIRMAIEKVITDSLNPRTIFLDDGNYSSLTTNEIFPIKMKSFLTLQGDSDDVVIIDAARGGRVFHLFNVNGVDLKYITITGGLGTGGSWNCYGGGIYCKNSRLNLENVQIKGNDAPSILIVGIHGYGGGIYCEGSQINVKNSAIQENCVGECGGAIYIKSSHYEPASKVDFENVIISGNTSYGVGGGITHFGDVLTLKNVTISGNRADWGGSGIYQNGGSIYLVNTIVWNNVKEEIHLQEGNNTIVIAYSDVEGGADSVIVGAGGSVFWLEGNIDTDPLFIEPDSGDFYLQKGSPCIDAGTAFFIWQGDTIIDLPESAYNGEAPDMGVHETEYEGISKDKIDIPEAFLLAQNYPNPFNPETTVAYQLPKTSHVRLIVYNMLGQEVVTLVDDFQDMGSHQIVWNGKDNRGIKVPSDLYIIKMDCGEFVQSQKVLFMK